MNLYDITNNSIAADVFQPLGTKCSKTGFSSKIREEIETEIRTAYINRLTEVLYNILTPATPQTESRQEYKSPQHGSIEKQYKRMLGFCDIYPELSELTIEKQVAKRLYE